MPVAHTPLLVSAAVIVQGDSVLIAHRSSSDHGSGGWEFPGGKVEPGESPPQCLCREITEELGISISIICPFMDYTFQYPNRCIHLFSFKALIIHGVPVPAEHDEIAWVLPADLHTYQFLPADMPIVNRLADPLTLHP